MMKCVIARCEKDDPLCVPDVLTQSEEEERERTCGTSSADAKRYRTTFSVSGSEEKGR